jgi:acyl carrier protein
MLDDLNDITAIVCRVGGLPRLGPDDDFYQAGFSSIKALELLLELESACAVSIVDEQFIAARTPRALCSMIGALKQEVEA